MKQAIKSAAFFAAFALAAPAFAGETVSNDSLVDVLLKKGVITKDEAKAAAKENNGRLQFSGKAFIDFSNSVSKNDATGVKTDSTTGLNIGRFYMTAKYFIDDVWSTRITTDVNNEQPNATGLKRNMNVFLKAAHVQGHFSDAVNVMLGLGNTPWIDYEQGLWKHRYAAQVMSDVMGYEPSADYGVALHGSVADNAVKYYAMASNGGGYGKPNKSNKLDYQARVSFDMIEGLDISLGYRSGFLGASTFKAPSANQAETLTQIMASYGTDMFRVGANYLINKQNSNAGAVVKNNEGTSLWGWVKVDEFGGFARIDNEKAKNTVANLKDKRYVAGVEYFAAKGMTAALQWTGLKQKQSNNRNDTIGLYTQFAF